MYRKTWLQHLKEIFSAAPTLYKKPAFSLRNNEQNFMPYSVPISPTKQRTATRQNLFLDLSDMLTMFDNAFLLFFETLINWLSSNSIWLMLRYVEPQIPPDPPR
jgi:hypothetical protein